MIVREKKGREPVAMPQNVLSFGEAVVVADVRDRDEKIRKDIETGVLPTTHIVRRFNDRRLAFAWNYVFTLAAVYRNDSLSKDLRRTALIRVRDFTMESDASAVFSVFSPNVFVLCADHHGCVRRSGSRKTEPACNEAPLAVSIDTFLKIDMKPVCAEVRPRVSTYAEGLNRIESRKGVLGGEMVFKKTRLPVMHIGGMLDAGETMQGILEDYPNLSESDVRFAHMYFLAHPPIGRPRTSGEADGVIIDAG